MNKNKTNTIKQYKHYIKSQSNNLNTNKLKFHIAIEQQLKILNQKTIYLINIKTQGNNKPPTYQS